jgi:hypothetical protein
MLWMFLPLLQFYTSVVEMSQVVLNIDNIHLHTAVQANVELCSMDI